MCPQVFSIHYNADKGKWSKKLILMLFIITKASQAAFEAFFILTKNSEAYRVKHEWKVKQCCKHTNLQHNLVKCTGGGAHLECKT